MQICIQSLRIEKIDIRISFAVESYATYNCLFFVLGYELPEYMVVVFKWIYQTIVISGLYQMLDFLYFRICSLAVFCLLRTSSSDPVHSLNVPV